MPRPATIAVLVLALVLRVAVLLITPGALVDDPDNYRGLAANLLENGVFGAGEAPTAYRPPLYPLLVAACVAAPADDRIAIGALHIIAGLLTVASAIWLSRRLGLERLAWAPAVLVAVDPVLLRQTALVMTEVVAACLAGLSVVALVWAHQRRRPRSAVVAGVVLGLAALCRPTFLPWSLSAPIVFGWLSAKSYERFDRKQSLLLWMAMLVACVATLAPWVARNYVAFGRPIITTTHGGYTLLLGNNPEYYDHLRRHGLGPIWTSEALDARIVNERGESDAGKPRDEVAHDRAESAEAWRHIREEPAMFLAAAAIRLASLAGVLPLQLWTASASAKLLAAAITAWYALQLVLATRGVWLLRSKLIHSAWLWIVLLIATFAIAHAFYWSNTRMRAPLTVAIALVATAGVAGCQASNLSATGSKS